MSEVILPMSYPVWQVAKFLGRRTGAFLRQCQRSGWAVQDFPLPRSPWRIPSEILGAHLPGVKKKLDAAFLAGIPLSNRGRYRNVKKRKKA